MPAKALAVLKAVATNKWLRVFVIAGLGAVAAQASPPLAAAIQAALSLVGAAP